MYPIPGKNKCWNCDTKELNLLIIPLLTCKTNQLVVPSPLDQKAK